MSMLFTNMDEQVNAPGHEVHLDFGHISHLYSKNAAQQGLCI